MLIERSRLGEESLDEGFDERDKEDLGLVGGAAESSGRRILICVSCCGYLERNFFFFWSLS